MDASRRTFLEELLVSGSLVGLMAGVLDAQNGSAAVSPKSESQKFWNSFFDGAQPGAKGAVSDTIDKLIAPQRRVTYLVYTDNRLRYAHEVKKEELLDHPGDVAVSVTMGQFQPGADDHKSVAQNQSAQLRIDCTQTRSLIPNFLAPMAWCALASVYTDQAGKVPSLQSLGWQNDVSLSGANRIVLPGGMGKVAVNVSLARKESMIHKILTQAVTTGSGLSPLLGLPGLSIQALKTFTDIYSYLEQKSAFILNSALTDAAATQTAVDAGEISQNYVPLISGQYVLIPTSYADKLGDQLGKYQLNQGYLIDTEKAGNKELQIEKLKDMASPGVTYLSLKMTVSPVDAGAAAADSKANAAAAGGTVAPPSNASQKSQGKKK